MKFISILFVVFVLSNCNFGHKQPDEVVVNPEIIIKDYEAGKIHFERDCNACHRSRSILNISHIKSAINKQGENYVRLFITKQDSLMAAGDVYAKALKEEFGTIAGVHNFKYPEQYLDDLMDFLKKE